MKKLFTLLALLFCLNAQSQYVTIPDANFAAYLQSIIPAAMNGNQMDTTNTLVTTTSLINVQSSSISNLSGVQYFHSLTYLACGNNSLTSLPNLPTSLTNLFCWGNSLSNLPTLPTSLSYLDCHSNSLTTLPTLPDSLKNLICSGNQLTFLPALPSSLTELECDNNNIHCFKAFPKSITVINIDNNPYTCLPNYAHGMSSTAFSAPLCTAGNANGCDTAVNVQNFVILPDQGFNNYLIQKIPSAMYFDGNTVKMDINDSAVTSLDSIKIFYPSGNLTNLTGIQYFTSLVFLSCISYQLNYIPSFPASLKHIDCSQNQLSSIPALPNSLIFLNCGLNQLTNLPTLPNSLTFLNCGGNPLTTISSLPSALQTLYCFGNSLSSLPTLPATLINLFCDNNQLNNLSGLPGSLKSLSCSNNSLTSLPVLPVSLNYLRCFNNQITNLSVTTNTLLTYLDCSQNNISNIAPLPASLKQLVCNNNALTNLPPLPALDTLFCSYNNISCFPPFPNSISANYRFQIDHNPYSCLPNYISAMDIADLTLPLCATGNADACNAVAPNCGTNFTYTVAANNAGQVNFSIASTDSNNTWHFGDIYSDTVQIGIAAQHFYRNGTYTVQCVAKDSSNQIICLTTQTITITNSTVGIKSVSYQNTDITIYPNPAGNKITVDATNVIELKLFDVIGNQITTTKENYVDVSTLTNGVYFVQVKTSQGISTQKIVVQH